MVFIRIIMKRLFFSLLLVAAASMSFAQNNAPQVQPVAVQTSAASAPVLRYGYLSYDSVLHRMPDYALACHNISSLKSNYDAEMKRVEDEFNTKYEFFLQDQSSLAPTILQKRQAELQELMEKNLAFKEKAANLLKQAEEDALAPVRKKLNAAISQIGERRGLAFVLNTDNNAAPWLNPSMGEDITEAVLRVMQ